MTFPDGGISLIILEPDLSYCGEDVVTEANLKAIDLTTHPNLVLQDAGISALSPLGITSKVLIPDVQDVSNLFSVSSSLECTTYS